MSSLEPEAKNMIDKTAAGLRQLGGTVDFSMTNAASLVSIAISLKRIADVVAGVPYDPAPGADNSKNRLDLVNGVMHAIEQGILAAARM